METTVLSLRQRDVLRAVITDHIVSGEPVGSRTISRRHDFHLSPASIRNIMADLEEMGFLAQPHTSAGRVPTDRGYRLYVDSLMEPEDPGLEVARRLREAAATSRGEVEDLLREISRLLADLTRYTCVALAPRLDQDRFRSIEFVSLGRDRLLVIFISTSGLVQHRVVALEEPIGPPELERISCYLSEVLEGKTLSEVRAFVVERMAEEKTLYDRLLARALSLARRALEEEPAAQLYLDGASHLARQPEFADVEKMRDIFAAFEEKSKLLKVLDACLRDVDVTVVIGSEGAVPGLAGLSVIAAPYRAGRALVGVVGLLGPTRMPYARMVPLVAYTAGLVSHVITRERA